MDKATEEEFLHHLYRGSELLAAGEIGAAKEHVERAFELQPKNEKGQNLLGLTYFKLGMFERAAEIYEELVLDNPADATLRVNLGLVYLKTSALERAVREFETAVELAPDHKKAHNYLGLALAQAEDFGRAKEHFLLAGSELMAEKMSRAQGERGQPESPGAPHEGEGDGAPGPESPSSEPSDETPTLRVEGGGQQPPLGKDGDVPARAFEQHAVPVVSIEGEGIVVGGAAAGAPMGPGEASAEPDRLVRTEPPEEAKPLAAVLSSDWGSQFGLDVAEPRGGPLPVPTAPMRPPREDIDPEEAAEAMERMREAADAGASAGMAPVPPAEPRVPTTAPVVDSGSLGGLAASALTMPSAGPPFLIERDRLVFRVSSELFARLDGLVGFWGRLEILPERKRFRGKATEHPFGVGPRQVMRLRGSGVVVVERGARHHFSVRLHDEALYVREEVLLAFEEPVLFENGRLSSEVPPDLELVHLRGEGFVLLRVEGPIQSAAVGADQPVTVPVEHLVGWFGSLSPRMVPVGWDSARKPSRTAVELSGEGTVLFSVPTQP